MDLEFHETVTNYLKKAVHQIQNQEETLETVIPDSMPDADRIVGCWGVPIIRSREWRTGGMSLNGGIEARVLYLPPEEETPQLLEMYLPFSIKWEQPLGDEEGRMRHEMRIRGMDARIVNSRKILVRANLTALGEAFQKSQETSRTLGEKPRDLEVLQEKYPLLMPAELTERSFLVDEDLDLPAASPEVSHIVRYSLQPEITDQKVMGGKGVFKGMMLLHLLYLDPENQLRAWDVDVPFSQYAELDQVYDNEEELQTTMMLSSVDVSAEEGRKLRLRAGVIAQCMVMARQNVELLRDAYSLRREVNPQFQDFGIQSRLDRQYLRQQGEFSAPLGNITVLDGILYPEFPRVERAGERARIEVPFGAVILFRDEDGTLQNRMGSGTLECETKLAENCRLEANVVPNGRLQWSVGGGNGTLRGSFTVMADSFAQEQIPVICQLEMGEERAPDPQRPSVIVRMADGDGSLWSLAKACGSTREAIRGANRLESDYAAPERMLLVPIL